MSAAALCTRGQLVLRLPDSSVPASHLATGSTNHVMPPAVMWALVMELSLSFYPPSHLAAQEDF